MAQLGARLDGIEEVEGSNPFGSTKNRPTRLAFFVYILQSQTSGRYYVGQSQDLAEYGFMLWDGKSKGTINNVVNLSRDHKPVVVYVAPTKQFRTIKTADDLRDLLAQGDSDSVERIVSELHLEVQSHRAAG